MGVCMRLVVDIGGLLNSSIMLEFEDKVVGCD